ncbi:Ribosomal protein S12 mitochondrial, partial [Bienertia sinuspersici]
LLGEILQPKLWPKKKKTSARKNIVIAIISLLQFKAIHFENLDEFSLKFSLLFIIYLFMF